MTCGVAGCQRAVRARGFCDTHYRRFKKHGDASINRRVIHGMYGSPEYVSWKSMLQRCYSEHHKSFRQYGGRGISVCERWLAFKHFVADMGPRPKGTTLDRLRADGNYEPGNCRWATPKQQSRNKHSTPRIRVGGKLEAVADLAEEHGLAIRTVQARRRRGWPEERLLSPVTK